MLIFSKVNSLDSLSNLDTVSIPSKLIEYVATRAGIPALGLWVLLCNQTTSSKMTKELLCQKYNLSEAAFDKTMKKLQALNLAWHEYDPGFENDWFVSNLPKAIAIHTEKFLFQLENLFSNEEFGLDKIENEVEQAFVKADDVDLSTSNNTLNNQHRWETLELSADFLNVASTKIPKELVHQYWDSFTSSNDIKGEIVPERNVLFKKWKAYIANVSVNLAVSERRHSNNLEVRAKNNSVREKNNIDAWQALLEQPIPQAQSFTAAINNLSNVENDVWIGFIQQNIRFKNDPMNLTNLQYAFEEYCKTTGQKFLRKKAAQPSEFDYHLSDTSWANNLDDVL